MNPPDAGLPATVLIVDDVPANIGVVADTLEAKGYRVLVAGDGAEALRRVARLAPDLILLDVMMPGLDGFAVCRRLKADPATRDIPVLFMTALADGTDKLAGFEAGAVDYLTKPVDTAEVAARVHTHLALSRLQQDLAARNRALQETCTELAAANLRLTEAKGQLLQSEKMASIGLLAAGVAHEINNPLGYVSSNLAILDDYVARLLGVLAAHEAAEPELAPARLAAIRQARAAADLDFLKDELPPLLAESRHGLIRIQTIVQDLKEFSHAGGDWQPADLNRTLDSALNIAAHELKYKARVTKDYGALPEIECLPQELAQVFINLLVNAAQAIADQGEISVRTRADGEAVWVEIADTGCGIAPEHLEHIFDPFFTTKPVGKGTGLGLSVSFATVQRHGGDIEVESAPGQGTRFSIRLPVRRPAA